jgi:Lrp/AsnC family transcriptional regulator of ectoine degradation
MKLDRYDIAILNVLQQNGRISKRDLADRIGLSVSPCWVRMRKLEDMGYIQGYNASIEFDRIARFCYVTTLVRLETHHAADFKRFEKAIQATPQIVHCEAVIGEIDYILKFVTTDIDHYQQLIESLLEQDIGIMVYFSHVRSKAIKEDSSELLDVLLNEMADEY